MIYFKRLRKKVIVELGFGDVGVDGGLSNNPNIGIFAISNTAPAVIGLRVTLDDPITADSCPIVCIFHKTESIDVWIRELTKLKKLMNDEK